MSQLLPFHLSARADPELDGLLVCDPTAVQARPEEHDTAESTLISAPAGFGVGSTFHVLPVALAGWLAWAAPAVAIPVKASSNAATPSSRVARVQRSPVRNSLPSRLV
jgi:hypothetical protein